MTAVSQQFPPGKSTVALWRWSLLATPSEQGKLWEVLCRDEQARADQFHFPRDRRRYIVGRGTLRVRLAGYLGCSAKQVAFSYGKFGKPALIEPDWQNRLSFNLSHSDDLAILAVAGGALVGVDLERVRPITDDFMDHSFAADELEMLRALPKDQYEAAAFACWTRKEAYVKALGTGLSHSLDSFAVSIQPALPARLLRDDGDPAEVGHWTLVELAVEAGYAAALAIRQRSCNVQWQTAEAP